MSAIRLGFHCRTTCPIAGILARTLHLSLDGIDIRSSFVTNCAQRSQSLTQFALPSFCYASPVRLITPLISEKAVESGILILEVLPALPSSTKSARVAHVDSCS